MGLTKRIGSVSDKIRHYPKIIVLTLCTSAVACSLFEDLENTTYSDQTIELLTGSIWNIDSLVAQVIIPPSDSLFLNYGTLEFQSPKNNQNPGNNSGYVIHRYVKKGIAQVDTMAWEPHGVGSREPDSKPLYDFTLYEEDPNGQPGYFNGLALSFKFKISEKSQVNMQGEGGGSAAPGSDLKKIYRRYHLTR